LTTDLLKDEDLDSNERNHQRVTIWRPKPVIYWLKLVPRRRRRWLTDWQPGTKWVKDDSLVGY
jgi:hypothetical protein